MLWIALHLPALPLQAFAATLGSVRLALPLALLDSQRIRSVNRVALQLGVQPGLKRATALALAPQLVFGHADSAREGQALQAVAHAALAFTPSVAIESMQRFRCDKLPVGLAAEHDAAPCVLLEVQASLRYFGGLAALQHKLQAALAPLGFSHRLASAPTAAGAALLARWRDGLGLGPHSTQLQALHTLLDQLPVELLDTAREHAVVLQSMGVHTLADLRRLPRASLARRFGDALLLQMDRARGEQADPQHWLAASERFEARLELFERTDNIEQVLHGAAVLLARLVAWAQARHVRILAFTLAMRHDGADAPACTTLQVNLAEASNDSAHLQLLLRERLAHVSLPAPTLQLRLRCEQVVRRAAPNGQLFPTPASADEGLIRLLERLQARMGGEQVQRLVPVEDHRPERATVWQPALPVLAAPRLPCAAALPVRPVWLLAQPQPLHERQLRPLLDGRALQLLSGPERIEAGWWDGETAARDYFIAQTHDLALVWIYRARLPDSPAGEGWFLHGRFG